MLANSGYIGSKRSVRSQNAIEDYEVPLTMINKSLIEEFLDENKDDFNSEDLIFLKKLKVTQWKYIASQRILPSSWHHTSSFFNKTDHYSLLYIAKKAIEIKDSIDLDFEKYKEKIKKEKENKKEEFKYGVINVEVWGGTRNHPKVVDYHEVSGIIIGNWLYYHDKYEGILKYKTNANKVVWIKEYNSYAELVKKHSQYKNTKRIFNEIIKLKL